jgi:hypothetical protein
MGRIGNVEHRQQFLIALIGEEGDFGKLFRCNWHWAGSLVCLVVVVTVIQRDYIM